MLTTTTLTRGFVSRSDNTRYEIKLIICDGLSLLKDATTDYCLMRQVSTVSAMPRKQCRSRMWKVCYAMGTRARHVDRTRKVAPGMVATDFGFNQTSHISNIHR